MNRKVAIYAVAKCRCAEKAHISGSSLGLVHFVIAVLAVRSSLPSKSKKTHFYLAILAVIVIFAILNSLCFYATQI